MKSIFVFFCALVLATPALHSQTNRYDLLGRLLVPLASVFDPKAENRALSGSFILEEASGLPPEWRGARLEVALQAPDRFLVRVVKGGEAFALCRDGQRLWFTPAEKVRELLPASEKGAGGGKPSSSSPLPPMRLAFPAGNLQFLPTLFEIDELEPRGAMRLLEVRPMPLLTAKEKGRKTGAPYAVLTIDERNPQAPRLAHLRFQSGKRFASIRIEGLSPVATLPEETWTPPEEGGYTVSKGDLERWRRYLADRFGAELGRWLQP